MTIPGYSGGFGHHHGYGGGYNSGASGTGFGNAFSGLTSGLSGLGSGISNLFGGSSGQANGFWGGRIARATDDNEEETEGIGENGCYDVASELFDCAWNVLPGF